MKDRAPLTRLEALQLLDAHLADAIDLAERLGDVLSQGQRETLGAMDSQVRSILETIIPPREAKT